MAKSLYGVVVGHAFRNIGETIMFLKSGLRFGDEKQKGLIGQEGDSKDIPRQPPTSLKGQKALSLLALPVMWLAVCLRACQGIPLCPDDYAALKEHRN